MKKTHAPNGVGHFDIAGPDIAALSRFYSAVLDWQIAQRGPGYAMVGTPEGGPDGALVEAETAALTLGVVVPDLEKSLDAAVTGGGSVAMPMVDNGWVKKAQIRDPAGNLLTLIQA